MNSDGSKRPSLLAGQDRSGHERLPSNRILADMDGRPPDRTGSPPRRLLSAALLASLLGLLLWWWHPAPPAGHHQPTPASQPPLAAAPAVTLAQPPAAALIVDSPPPPLQDVAVTQPQSSATAPAPTAQAQVAPPVPASSNRRRTHAPHPKQAHPHRSRAHAEPPQDLFATLLAIIQRKPATTAPLDGLIARSRSQPAAATAAPLALLGQSTSTESGIQNRLRHCPSANTLQGIECRRQICVKLAGRDPACPAR